MIRKHTGTKKDVTITIKMLKWKWAGYTIRGIDKWSKTIIELVNNQQETTLEMGWQNFTDQTMVREREKWSQLEAFALKKLTDVTSNKTTEEPDI